MTKYKHGQEIEYSNGQTAKVVRVNERTGAFAIRNPEGLYAHCIGDPKQDDEVWGFVDEAAPWIPQWQFEFGHFPAADMPAIPEGFVDASYGNDMCPSFENEAAGWRLWVDYADESMREHEGMPRFSLCPCADGGSAWEDSHVEFETWDEVLRFLKRWPTLAAFETSQPAKG